MSQPNMMQTPQKAEGSPLTRKKDGHKAAHASHGGAEGTPGSSGKHHNKGGKHADHKSSTNAAASPRHLSPPREGGSTHKKKHQGSPQLERGQHFARSPPGSPNLQRSGSGTRKELFEDYVCSSSDDRLSSRFLRKKLLKWWLKSVYVIDPTLIILLQQR